MVTGFWNRGRTEQRENIFREGKEMVLRVIIIMAMLFAVAVYVGDE